jgi:predicted Zn-dependent peptidase
MSTSTEPTVTTLPSGVRVVTEHVAGVRSAALGLWVDVGSRDEAPGDDGSSHFLEHLLFKGTGRRSARDIAEAIDAVGGEMNAFTSKEVTCFHARVLDRDLPIAFDVLADLIVDARNAPDDVEVERDVVLAEIDAHNDSPDDLAHTDAVTGLLGTHPLARETLGSEATITAIDRDRIHAHYLAHYRPATLVVAAAGNVVHDEVVAFADTMLGDLGRPGEAPRDRAAPTAYGAGEVLLRDKPIEQAHVVLAMPGMARDDEALPTLAVLSTLLGGGMSSRLFQSIREQRGLAYSTYSFVSAFSDGGMVGAYLGTAPERVEEALRALAEELDRLPGDLTEAEVHRARATLVGGRLLGAEDSGSRMHRIGSRLMAGLELRSVEGDVARFEAVTVDDVRRLAERLLAAPRVLSIVGPFRPRDRERLARAVGLAA